LFVSQQQRHGAGILFNRMAKSALVATMELRWMMKGLFYAAVGIDYLSLSARHDNVDLDGDEGVFFAVHILLLDIQFRP
jgi:hypothetical protein